MKRIFPLRLKISRLLTFSIILFVLLYVINIQTTAFDTGFTLGWTLVGAFIKNYLFIILLYFCFMLYDSFHPIPLEEKQQLEKSLQKVLKVLQQCFLVAISLQVIVNLYDIWYELGLYPIELGFWESVWTLIRYFIGLIGTWLLEFWFWVGKQLRISFLLNNPCIGSFCLEEYPWVSVLLTALLGYVGKQLWKLSLVRGTIRFFFHIVYNIVKTVGMFVLKRLSQKASEHISSKLLLGIATDVYGTLKDMYQFSPEEVTEPQQVLE